MSFNFPDTPTLGQQVTGANGVVYQWDGAKWAMVASTSYLPLSGGTMTGALTPSQTAGVVGTTTNNNAAAGSVGEFVSSSGTSTALTSGTPANVASGSISLTAGDWDVWGYINLTPSGGAATVLIGASSLASAALPPAGTPSQGLVAQISGASITLGASQMAIPQTRMTFAATTTVYLIAYCAFPSGTATATGGLMARRRR